MVFLWVYLKLLVKTTLIVLFYHIANFEGDATPKLTAKFINLGIDNFTPEAVSPASTYSFLCTTETPFELRSKHITHTFQYMILRYRSKKCITQYIQCVSCAKLCVIRYLWHVQKHRICDISVVCKSMDSVCTAVVW